MSSPYRKPAESTGWFYTKTAHVIFKQSGHRVCRHLKAGETYNEETDTLIRVPLRHAANWKQACAMDGLKP